MFSCLRLFFMIRTPKGIMYLISSDEQTAYCYDDQTGRDEVFLLTEIQFL